jgi:hypothetical protein
MALQRRSGLSAFAALFCLLAIPAAAQDIPFRTAGDFGILVEGSVAGFPGCMLLLDTGSQRSVIDGRVAARVPGVRSPARVVVVGQTTRVEQIVLPSMAFGPVEVGGLSVLIEDLSSLDRAWGVHIDGIIGMDVLRRQNFAVDFEAHRIHFGRLPELGNVVAFQKEFPCVILQVELDGHPARLIFDTGMKDVLVFESRVRGWGLSSNSALGVVSSFVAPEHRLRLNSLPVRTVRLGSENLGSWDVLLADSEKDSPPAMDGFLGAFSLHARAIAFDFDNGLFSWSAYHGL